MGKKIIAMSLITGIVGAFVGSASTIYYLGGNNTSQTKANTTANATTTSAKTQIVVNNDEKTQNVYHAVTEKAMPSVVGITTTTINADNIYSMSQKSEGVGTGVIVDSNGYILTNSHVISDGSAVDVNVLFNDSTTTKGKVLWHDATLDLAIVKVDKTGLVAADLGNSDEVRVGDISIAIGNPLGLEFQKSVTQGIISGLDRTIQTEKATMTGLMQTDASINPGNSGGPLLNSKGQVIGINTAKASEAEGLGFSIPINVAKSIVHQMITTGTFEKVTLGIKGIDVKTYALYQRGQSKLSTDKGVYIAETVENTPAKKGGIQQGDIIVKIDDTTVDTMSDLTKALYGYTHNHSAKVTINRNGTEKVISVKF